MKTTLLLLLLCCVSINIFGQKKNAFYDAQKLSESIQNGVITVKEEHIPILARYIGLTSQNIDLDVIESACAENPFLKSYLSFTEIRGIRGVGFAELLDSERGFSSDASDGATGMSLSPATFLLGLSDFLVQRTKQELHIAFFQKFNEKVKSSQELQLIFPQTAQVLATIEEDIYHFNAFWDAIRESFMEDLDELPSHLSDYFQESDRIKDPNIKAFASDCFEVMDMLQNEKAPTDVIRYLSTEAYLQSLSNPDPEILILQQNLKLIGLFSEAMEYMDDSRYWITTEELNRLLKDSIHVDLFMGLLYQKGKELKVGSQTLGYYLKALRPKQLEYRFFIKTLQKFVVAGNNLHKKVQESRRKSRNSSRDEAQLYSKEEQAQDFYDYVEESLDLVDYAYRYKKHLMEAGATEDSLFHHYVSTTRDLNKLILDVRLKKYAVAVIGAIIIIEKILPDSVLGCQQKLLMKYGSFMATAIDAKTPEEVSAAINAFALPPGSAAMKKQAAFSVTLNAYVGAGGGMEYLKGLDAKPYYAIAAPVGISFNFGLKKAGYLGLFAPIIDVGALTAFRFTDPNTNPLPDLKFVNVFAPGGYLVYGVPKFPLSLGVGAQLGPNIRSVNNQPALNSTSGWRLGAFLTVDIPIVNLFTTEKRYKACRGK